uniref:Uncharacterized protein n=1 Tax=Opuntia streptacantha TaxID=393608 RepID=A0A7C9D416_OPUST
MSSLHIAQTSFSSRHSADKRSVGRFSTTDLAVGGLLLHSLMRSSISRNMASYASSLKSIPYASPSKSMSCISLLKLSSANMISHSKSRIASKTPYSPTSFISD